MKYIFLLYAVLIKLLIANTFIPESNSQLNYRQLELSWPQLPNSNSYQITITDNNKVGQASKSAAGILFPLSPWKNSQFMQELCISGHNEYNNFFNNLDLKDRKEINYKRSNIIIFGENLKYAKEWYKKNKLKVTK